MCPQFNINRQTGVIRLVGPSSPLAQHSEEDYTFTVVARDTHNLNDTATVHVHVIGESRGRPLTIRRDHGRSQGGTRPSPSVCGTLWAEDPRGVWAHSGRRPQGPTPCARIFR